MQRLILVRHGQTEANAQGRTVATSDPALNSLGIQQATQVANRLRTIDIDLVVSSPSRRCTATAEAIADRQSVKSGVRIDNRLRELGMGVIEGLSHSDIRERGLDNVFRQWRQGTPPAYPDGAETFESAAERMLEALSDLQDEDCDTALVVGHSHSLRILIATAVLGVTPDIHRRLFLDHGTVATVFWESGVPRLGVVNAGGTEFR